LRQQVKELKELNTDFPQGLQADGTDAIDPKQQTMQMKL